jgi:hypothetical protein
MNTFFTANIADADPIVSNAIDDEVRRQTDGLELIASENFVSEAVLQTMGTVFTNKYAEGYPAKRYYGGCEFADVVENAAIERAKQLFGCDHANVQPHSGAQANMAVLMTALDHGDQILGMNLSAIRSIFRESTTRLLITGSTAIPSRSITTNCSALPRKATPNYLSAGRRLIRERSILHALARSPKASMQR